MSTTSFDPLHLFSAKGLIAVVTGGGTGVGFIIAIALESNGASVYIVGRRNLETHTAQGDVTSKESPLNIVSIIETETGYINLVVNNADAGVSSHVVQIPEGEGKEIKSIQKTLWDIPLEGFLDVYRVNVFARLLHHPDIPGPSG